MIQYHNIHFTKPFLRTIILSVYCVHLSCYQKLLVRNSIYTSKMFIKNHLTKNVHRK